MTDKELEQQYKNELLAEHLGFMPLTLVDDVINAINELLYEATTTFQEFAEEHQGVGDHTETGMNQLETILEHNIDYYFDIFELYTLNHILTIPDNLPIILPHYKDISTDETSQDPKLLQKELEQVRDTLQSTLTVNSMIKNQMPKINHLLNRLQTMAEKTNLIVTATESTPDIVKEDEVKFIVKQAKLLEKSMKSLRITAEQPTWQTKPVPPTTRDVYLGMATRVAIDERKAIDRKRNRQTAMVDDKQSDDEDMDDIHSGDDSKGSQKIGRTHAQLQEIATLDSIEMARDLLQ
ncbi:Mis12 protein-domain-containing protein [Syncephalis fuscata]|nr:Mis12 protein-domain-containing protein [Syncephalis fuscata]